jgi:predicted P-loop ATPase
LLLTPGDKVELKGNIETLGALTKRGGFYTDSLVARLDSINMEHNRKAIEIYANIVKYRETIEKDSLQKYSEMYNRHQKPTEMRELNKYLMNDVNDNEYAAYLYLEALYNITATQLEERFARFNPDIQASYMGRR